MPLLSTHTIDEDRMSTPELRPEDFPPGVAYLPDGDDDDPEEDFPSKNTMIDFASTIETVKTVSEKKKKILKITVFKLA